MAAHHFKRERIPVADIVFDAGTQIRVSINEQVVIDYAEQMTEGVEFPPVVLFHDGVRYYLADGFHRTLAAKRNQFRDIEADVEVGTRADALWFALAANKTNGQRLTEADKTHAVGLALKAWPEKVQREIAEQVGCSTSLVSKVALRIANNTGVSGDLRGRALLNHKKREQIREMVAAGAQSVEIRDKLRAHPGVIADVREEMGVGRLDRSKAATKERYERIRELAGEGYTSKQIASAVGLDERRVPLIAKTEGIDLVADRVVGKMKRHDANRIVAQIVADAENLIEGVDLIDFTELDRTQITGWLKSLQDSRNNLGGFIRRLMKEQQKHGEAA